MAATSGHGAGYWPVAASAAEIAIMIDDKTIAVVIPSYNVERLVARVVQTLPEFVDFAVVVNDASQDGTEAVLRELAGQEPWTERLIIIDHEVNRGVGAAIATGYKWCRDQGIDVTAVMAGDGQMDPENLRAVVQPVVEGIVDYAKGNRLVTPQVLSKIPKVRLFGNSILSLLTKIASGYWHVSDSQTGYTAASLRVLQTIDLDKIYPRYGMPNDMLVKLNIYNFRVMDVPVAPVYNVGEQSGIKIGRVVFTISFLLVRLFFKRLYIKYVLYDFHPLVLFYCMGGFLITCSVVLGLAFFAWSMSTGVRIPTGWLLVCAVGFIGGMHSTMFAMWLDMDFNRQYYVMHKDMRPRA